MNPKAVRLGVGSKSYCTTLKKLRTGYYNSFSCSLNYCSIISCFPKPINRSFSTQSIKRMSYLRFINGNAKKRKPSLIREMTKMLETVKPGTVFMAGGLPNSDLFPVESFSFSIDSETRIDVSGAPLKAALQYQSTQGYRPLLESLRSLQLEFHNPPNWSDSEIIVTVGSQQGLSSVLEMTISQGDPVIVPAPVYSSTLSIMDPLSPKYLSVLTDSHGMDPKVLVKVIQDYEQSFGSTKMPKIIYVNPTGANPSGVNIPFERKQEIYQIAQKYDLLILEDDPYYFLHFERDNPRSFLSIDTDGRVVRFDSFSKILSAGIRIGFVTGPKELIRHLELSMQTSVLHASSLSQVLVDEILRKWGLEGFTSHTKKAREFYKKRRDIMLHAAEKHLTGLAEFDVPGGGMFLWIRVIGVKDTYEMVMKHGIREGILLLPGNQFFPDRNAPCPFLRAAFSIVSFDDMNKMVWRRNTMNIKLIKPKTHIVMPS